MADTGELGEKIRYLENQLSIIDENINNLKMIKQNIIWKGLASLKFNEYYLQNASNHKKVRRYHSK